jgi:hypothetical protein
MISQPMLCNSPKQVLERIINSLKKEKLKFSLDGKGKFVAVPMIGDIQPFTIIVTVSSDILLVIIPNYLNLSPDVELENRTALFEKILAINDERALVKYSWNKRGDEVTLSVEVPWRFTVFDRKAVRSLIRLVHSEGSSRQRDLLPLTIPKPTKS